MGVLDIIIVLGVEKFVIGILKVKNVLSLLFNNVKFVYKVKRY